MAKKYKCLYCEDRYIRKDLIEHIDKEHEELIPDGSESAQVVYDLVNGTKGAGRCRVCNKATAWNSSSKRYDVLCKDPRCTQKMREEYKKNMLKVHGTYNILTSDEQQKKMLANRSISGKYKFTDGGVVTYTGSYEKKFLEFADKVMQIPSKDIMAPGPTIEYEMNGEKHFYITDFLYIPYNLIIEVKDGGSNPNNKNSEGMKSSRQRTIEKEKLITDRGEYNYLRLTDNQFVQLLEIFMDIKKALIEGNDDKIVRINESYIEESYKNNCIIVSCFAGVGKNYAINYFRNMGLVVNDIEKTSSINNMFGSSENFVKHIKQMSKKSDILFIPYFLEMEKNHLKGKIDYYLVYPSMNCKDKYMKRFKELGFTDEEMLNLSNNWSDMINDCRHCNISNNKKFELSDNEYVTDVLTGLLSTSLKESFISALSCLKDPSNIKEYHGIYNESSKYPDEIPQDIMDFLKELNSYDYGYVKDGRKIKGTKDFFENYKSLTISEFEKYKIGVCWDYVHYEANWFKQHKYKYETFYIQVQDEANDCPSHTYLVFYLPNSSKVYYFESSWGNHQGIEAFDNINELHNTIKNRHISEANSKCDPKSYFREKYNAESTSWEHLSCGDYMNKVSKGRINSNGSYISEALIDNMEDTNSQYLEKGDHCFNLNLWDPNDNNILYITGLSGSGKTTLGIDMAKNYNAYRVELDYLVVYYMKRTIEKNNRSKYINYFKDECPLAIQFLKTHEYEPYDGWGDGMHVIKDFLDWFVSKAYGDGNLYIINGAQIPAALEPEFFINKPIIIKHSDLFKSLSRRTAREEDYTLIKKIKYYIKFLFKASYHKAHMDMKSYAKDVSKYAIKTESYIEESKVKKICTKCGSNDVGVYIQGEPIYKCNDCGEYLGVVPFKESNILESYISEADVYQDKIQELQDKYNVQIYARKSIDVDGSKYLKFLPTDYVKNEYNIESLINENTYAVADLHFGKNKLDDIDTIKFLNKIPSSSILLILGDIGYNKEPDVEYLKKCFSKIKCKNIFLVLGNHDCLSLEIYYDLGIKGIYEKIFKSDKKWVFSHYPCDGPNINWINFHGHIHDEVEYESVKDVSNKINCYYKYFDKPLKIKELIEWDSVNNINKIIVDESYIEESTNIFTSGDFAEYREIGERRLKEIQDEESYNESLLIPEKDFIINMEKWAPGTPLWITGTSGDGKSTLAREMAKDKNAIIVQLDILLMRVSLTEELYNEKIKNPNSPFYDIKNNMMAFDYINQYPELPYGVKKDGKSKWLTTEEFTPYCLDFFDWIIYNAAHNPKYMDKYIIVEGCDIACIDPEYISKQPLIILGNSVVITIIRRAKRDSNSNPISFIKALFKQIRKYNSKKYLDDHKREFRNKVSSLYNEACVGGSAPGNYPYYHLAKSGSIKVLQPTVPNNYFTKNNYEDGITERVCFAPTIDKCLMAPSYKVQDAEFFVYVPDGDYHIYKPSISEVPDVKITGEVWVKESVKVKCIGKIKVINDAGKDGLPYNYGDNTAELYEWNYKWIDTVKESYISEARKIDNKSEIEDVLGIITYSPKRKSPISHDDLTKFTAYHLEPLVSAKSKRPIGGWDEELYSKSIEFAINNDIKDNYECKRYDKVSAYVYTAGRNLKPVYLGIISIPDKNNPNDWEWEEQEIIDKKTYDYLMNHPIAEATDISNFYEDDYED